MTLLVANWVIFNAKTNLVGLLPNVEALEAMWGNLQYHTDKPIIFYRDRDHSLPCSGLFVEFLVLMLIVTVSGMHCSQS